MHIVKLTLGEGHFVNLSRNPDIVIKKKTDIANFSLKMSLKEKNCNV